ncbi:bifunctional 2-polyprenyl-6-hydroxyphenol methylase/3-demethylubiquinol 3-O-methyltransferase UbiG [Synechococcus sp. MU1617]|uniref:class I SAM-dependent methyltransferase n=1 Tax=Synechococcus sp. MU1617 TaxID=2508346 RepID=UPI001CF8789C|nr:class I SAM-dependent methyltransferase [Synechococcus sp. MU1617]
MKDMLLSSHERLQDLQALKYFCANKRILDIGANTGHLGIQALQAGCLHITCIELDKKNIEVLSHMLPKNKTRIIESDLSQEENLDSLDGEFDTIFYLAVHQHLERKSRGSGFKLLEHIIELKPKHIITRAKGYTSELKTLLEKSFGDLTYYSHLETRIAPILGFTAR